MHARLQQVFVELFKVSPDQVTDSLSFQDVKGWDSLGHLSLIQSLEEMFSVSFEDGDLTEMDTVAAIKRVLELRGAGK
jgi:acyl carrier protein